MNTIEKIDLDCLYVDYEIFENSRKTLNSLKASKHSKSSNFAKNSNSNFYVDISLDSSACFDSSMTSNLHPNTHTNSLSTQNKKELKNSKLAYIYDLISVEPISINELCKKTSKPISQISNDLFLLELEGYIKKVAGGYICILNK